jgi:hypothetical protein
MVIEPDFRGEETKPICPLWAGNPKCETLNPKRGFEKTKPICWKAE